MQIHTLDKATLILDIQLSDHLRQAVSQGRHADFSLMLALLSEDPTETTPVHPPYPQKATEADLRMAFNLPEPIRLSAQEKDYELCREQANAFHKGGLSSEKLLEYTSPSALSFPAIGTHELGEDLYHNLCGHVRRKLQSPSPSHPTYNKANLYHELLASKRFLSERREYN